MSLNQFGNALDNPVLLADPSGLSANNVTKNTADDNQCFSNAGGTSVGNYVYATCLNAPAGAQVVTTVVGMPPNQYVVETVVFAKPGQGGGAGNRDQGPWEVTKEGTDKVVIHSKFGVFSRHVSSGLWWARDLAGHAASVWKVFTEEARGLRHLADADEFGNFIEGKHKGPVGDFIPWDEFRGR